MEPKGALEVEEEEEAPSCHKRYKNRGVSFQAMISMLRANLGKHNCQQPTGRGGVSG